MTPEIKIGDKVRSYDFRGNKDWYVEGVVVAIGTIPNDMNECDRYHIELSKVIADGKEDPTVYPKGTLVYPPVNGTPTCFGKVTEGVEKIS